MLNEEFYNHKAAVLMVQKTLQDILAEKGFEPEGLQIHEMLPLVKAIKGSVEYYKCAEVADNTWNGYRAVLVEETEEVEPQTASVDNGVMTVAESGTVVVVVSGSGKEGVDGEYPLSNGKTEQEAVYTKDNGYYFEYSAGVQEWFIRDSNGNVSCEGFSYNDKNPWDVTAWSANLMDVNESMTVTLAPAADPDQPEEPETPEPVFVEKFNGTLTNNFDQLGSAPEFRNIGNRQGMKCDYDHRLTRSAEGLPSGNSSRTLSAWIYCDAGSISSSGQFFCFYAGYGGDNNQCFYLSTIYNRVMNYCERLYEGSSYTAWGNLQTERWYHIAFTFDGSNMKCYIDGVLSGTANITYDTNVTDYPLAIGYLPFLPDERYNTSSYISDLRMYDVALSAEQVTKIYNGETEAPEEPETPEVKVKKYYTFEETLTTGLTYGYGFTPEVGKVYDATAMIQATLYSKAQLPETLYSTDFSNLSAFTLGGTVTSNVDASGRKFANFNRGRLSFEMSELPQSNSPWTMAFGVRNLQNYGDGVCFFNGGVTPGYDGLVFTGVENSAGGVFVTGWGDRITSTTSILNNSEWTRVLITYDGSTAAIYLNGVKNVEGGVSVNIRGTTCAFGGSFWGSYNLKADLADFKVWGIAFNQEQVNIDYEEFS